MTSTLPPNLPGSRRVVPHDPSRRQAELLRALLEQDRLWVLRGDWRGYLDDRIELDDGTDVAVLTRDHRIAARSWLRQQRHRLHETIEGSSPAPPGWIEQRPLYGALAP